MSRQRPYLQVHPGQARVIVLVIIPIISLLMHLRIFDLDLVGIHVWRQTETQEVIQNFYEEDSNLFNPRVGNRGAGDGITRKEFPLMQWMISGVYRVTGDSIPVTRAFMFFLSLLSIYGFYSLLRWLFALEGMAVMGAWAFAFSPVMYYYAVNPLPDNMALTAGIWGLAVFFRWVRGAQPIFLVISALLFAISALVKLPFILYYVVPATYLLVKLIASRFRKWLRVILFGIPFLISVIPVYLWYSKVIPTWEGNGVIRGMLDADLGAEGGHMLEILWAHVISILPELILNYGAVGLFIAGWYFLFKNRQHQRASMWMYGAWGLSMIAYFLFELNMIDTIHDYYLFPFLPALFMLVAYGAWYLSRQQHIGFKIFVGVSLAVLPLTAFLRVDTRWNEEKPGFNKDLLTYKQELRAAVPDTSLCVLGNDPSHHIIYYYTHKKGWSYDHDWLTGVQLGDMIRDGAQYLYSDSRELEQKADIAPLLEQAVAQHGSFKVWKLTASP